MEKGDGGTEWGAGVQAIAGDAECVTQGMLLGALAGITPQITAAMLAFYRAFADAHSRMQ